MKEFNYVYIFIYYTVIVINSFQSIDENKTVASLQSKDPKLLTKKEKELLDIYKTLN